MIPRLSLAGHRRHAAFLLANAKDWSLQASKRPVEPSKAVMQKIVAAPSLWLNPSEPATPSQGAPRRQLSSTIDFSERDSGRSVGTAGTSSRLRIAVDVDEVLGRFLHTLNQFYSDRYGSKYDVKDYWVYEYAKIWKCSQEQSNKIVHDFFKSRHFNDGIPVIPGAFEALTRMGTSCDLVVVTSRQHVIQDITLEWIDRHYPGLFQEVYFGNHFALEGASRKKSEICKSIGAGVLIDDNPGYALDCAQAGIPVLLYDWDHSYPWSKLSEGEKHPLITVVRDWEEAEQAVEVLARQQSNFEHRS